MRPVPAPRFGRRRLRLFALAVVMIAGLAPSVAAERGFPYGSEMMLDARPMKGSKRVPMLDIKPRGEVSIDLWCNSMQAQFVIAEDTLTVLTGTRTEQQCTPDRMRADDDLIAALSQVTTWRRDGDALTLRGPKLLRFRLLTH
ncbi:MAG: hypothetical protein QOC56_1873 [Alphaproteobacteria bacterium]|jgi:hypothetical protein|nr:hypothetical protein [Alphaproteobacteria bacterium]